MARIRTLLRHTMGLNESSIGTATLNRAITRAMTEAACETPAEYHRLLESSPPAVQALIEEVVVPESWFFRDPSAFGELQSALVPEIRRAAGNRPLRVMSIPCSRGEEPYSIAITLLEALGQNGQFSVTAVDISERSLEYAANADYSESAFREKSVDHRARYFEKTARGYRPVSRVRERVTFRKANLLSAEFERWPERYDCIFCRNLLIYFDRELKARVLTVFESLLNEPGFVVAAPAEAPWFLGGPFEKTNQAGSNVFRKRAVSPPHSAKHLPRKIISSGVVAPPLLIPEEPANPSSQLDHARLLADAGRIGDAAAVCFDYVQHHGTCIEGNYLLGLLHEAMKDLEKASVYYKRTVYLNPQHTDAMRNLALCHERQGDIHAAQQWRTRAERTGRDSS
jgi:chemotaxis protein methyltransferase WspC